MRLNREAARLAPEREAACEQQSVVIADHLDASTELGSGVVGAAGLAALRLEVRDGIGAIREFEHEVSSAGHVAAQAVGHDFGADHLHLVPERVGEEGFDPWFVVTRVRRLQARGWRWVPPLVSHHLQRQMHQIAPWLPDVTAGHDRLHLLWSLGHS